MMVNSVPTQPQQHNTGGNNPFFATQSLQQNYTNDSQYNPFVGGNAGYIQPLTQNNNMLGSNTFNNAMPNQFGNSNQLVSYDGNYNYQNNMMSKPGAAFTQESAFGKADVSFTDFAVKTSPNTQIDPFYNLRPNQNQSLASSAGFMNTQLTGSSNVTNPFINSNMSSPQALQNKNPFLSGTAGFNQFQTNPTQLESQFTSTQNQVNMSNAFGVQPSQGTILDNFHVQSSKLTSPGYSNALVSRTNTQNAPNNFGNSNLNPMLMPNLGQVAGYNNISTQNYGQMNSGNFANNPNPNQTFAQANQSQKNPHNPFF